VVAGLRQLGLSGLPPVGVSGIIEVGSSEGTYVVASMRSNRVAVNPGCLGPSVDGGLPYSPAGIDPRAGLRSEIALELPWDFDDDQFELLGTVLPPDPAHGRGRSAPHPPLRRQRRVLGTHRP